MKKDGKSGLWGTVIWNLILFCIPVTVFLKLLTEYTDKGFDIREKYAVLAVSGLFILVNITPTFKNIKKLYLSYKINEDGEKEEEIFMNGYSFLKMYQKLSLRRMFLTLFLSFTPILGILTIFIIFSDEKFSRKEMLTTRSFIFFIISKSYFTVFIIISLYLFFKICSAQKRNVELLFKIYDTATEEETRTLDSIQEKRYGYVFTKDFLINWDGFLNIIPLEEIKEIKYIKYFYLAVSGTRLRIKCSKKYTLWTYGPSEDEWIKRGFLSAEKKFRTGKSVNMNINMPI